MDNEGKKGSHGGHGGHGGRGPLLSNPASVRFDMSDFPEKRFANPGLLELVYQRVLGQELTKAGLSVELQK